MTKNSLVFLCLFVLVNCFPSVNAQQLNLLPEKGVIDPQLIRNEDVSYLIYSIRDSLKMPIGEFRNRVILNQRKDEVLRVQWTRRGKLELTDSSLAKLTTLYPIYLSSSHPNRNLILHFKNKKVSGLDLASTGDTILIVDSSKSAFFDANCYDLLIRALPLKKGYAAIIPVYSYEEGCLGTYKINTVDEVIFSMKDSSKIECFRVNITHKNDKIVMWIAKSDRKLLAMRTNYTSNFIIEIQLKQ